VVVNTEDQLMSSEMIEVEIQDRIALVRMAKPPVNAIDLEFGEALHDALKAVSETSDVRALVLTGQASVFCAGLDLKQIPGFDRGQQRAMVTLLNRLFGGLYGCPVPTVAAVNGHAIAGGMVLALACDYRICAEGDVALGLTEVRVGVPFPVAAIEVARGALSPAAARTLVQFGETVGPARALELAAVDEVAPAGELTERSMEVASNLAQIPAATYQAVKHQLRRPGLAAISDAIDHGADPTLNAWLTEETAAAAQAILEGAAA
jgi:enoyl-CoA hydratase